MIPEAGQYSHRKIPHSCCYPADECSDRNGPVHSKYGSVEIKRKNMIKRLIMALFAAGIFVVAGTGCHTAHGAGEDIERAGEKIQDHTPP